MPDKHLRDIWRRYGVLPPSLADGTRLGYTTCTQELLCASCANEQTYSEGTPRLEGVALLLEEGFLCDRCLKEFLL